MGSDRGSRWVLNLWPLAAGGGGLTWLWLAGSKTCWASSRASSPAGTILRKDKRRADRRAQNDPEHPGPANWPLGSVVLTLAVTDAGLFNSTAVAGRRWRSPIASGLVNAWVADPA